MATIQHTTENISGGIMRVTWSDLTDTGNDVGTQVFAPDHDVKDVHVYGTFGVGGEVIIQGSVDASTFSTLNDAQGNALVLTAAQIQRIQETSVYFRPQVTNGDVTTSITVTVLMKPKRNS